MGFISKMKDYLYALFVEHSILNIFWKNFHKIDEGVYRSAQMNPYTLKKTIKKYNLKTIMSFRADIDESALSRLEKKVCDEMGVTFQKVTLFSRTSPEGYRLEKLKKEFEEMEKPVLMHCKAGADRTSLAAVLYLYWNGWDIKKAMKKELGFWKGGHIKHSSAGIIDYFLEEFSKSDETDIIKWAKINKDRLNKEFKQLRENQGILNFINDKILRRE